MKRSIAIAALALAVSLAGTETPAQAQVSYWGYSSPGAMYYTPGYRGSIYGPNIGWTLPAYSFTTPGYAYGYQSYGYPYGYSYGYSYGYPGYGYGYYGRPWGLSVYRNAWPYGSRWSRWDDDYGTFWGM